MGCYQTDAAVGAECQRTSAGSDVSACFCWYAESCCIKLSQGCLDGDGEDFTATREKHHPPLFFTASPPRARIRYPLSFTCVRSSRHPAFLSGVQAWVSPRAAPLTRFWRQILVSLLCHSSHLNASLKAEADTQWTEERDAAVTNLAFLWGSPGGRLTLSLCRRSDPFLFTAAPPKMQVGLLYLWLTGSGCRKKKICKTNISFWSGSWEIKRENHTSVGDATKTNWWDPRGKDTTFFSL